MQPGGVFVENFATRRRSPEELALVRKVWNQKRTFLSTVAPKEGIDNTVFSMSHRVQGTDNNRSTFALNVIDMNVAPSPLATVCVHRGDESNDRLSQQQTPELVHILRTVIAIAWRDELYYHQDL